MTQTWPWTFSKDDPAGVDLEDRLQDVLDTIGQQFPVSGANLSNDVLRLNTTGTSRVIAMGTNTVTFTAAALSAETTITHGIVKAGVATAPANIQLTAAGHLVGTYSPITVSVKEGSVTTTQFVVQGLHNAALTRTVTFYWTAIA
jgi:hypothetical protein